MNREWTGFYFLKEVIIHTQARTPGKPKRGTDVFLFWKLLIFCHWVLISRHNLPQTVVVVVFCFVNIVVRLVAIKRKKKSEPPSSALNYQLCIIWEAQTTTTTTRSLYLHLKRRNIYLFYSFDFILRYAKRWNSMFLLYTKKSIYCLKT
jgi:hypothetical protein